jgi:flavin reductase (DIM6/NTAB) family NADH-FMN oxidoreductase RutF
MKRSFLLDQVPPEWRYPLVTSTVVPRPLAWVSTIAPDGTRNLAPHSFFTVASQDPPILQFTSVGEKDTLRNIRSTGEFVICLVSKDLVLQANLSSTNFPPGVDEFVEAGLTAEPSATVVPARVGESPVALECQLHQIIPVGNSFLVLGTLLCVALEEEVLDDTHQPHPLYERLGPVTRLGRMQWSSPGEPFDLARPHDRG